MKPKTKKKIRVFSKIICFIALIVLVLFLYYLKKLNVLPNKYFYLIVGVLSFLELIFILFNTNKKIKPVILIILDIFAILFMLVEGYGAYKLYQIYGFLDEDIKVTETKEIYYLMVSSESNYEDLKSIENKFVYYFNDVEDFDKLKQSVSQKVNVILTETDDYGNLITSVLDDKERIILVSEGNYNSYLENQETEENVNIDNIKNKFRILGEIELVSKIEQNNSDADLMSKPFAIYISGIDTRSNKMPTKSLSDVNIFVVVNPQTRDVLLVNTPRDYYVQVHGTKGLKDKLTHAGGIGGVKLSKATLEDLLGYKASHYIRVNFNSVIKLVDAIGGITINNEFNYSYTPRHGQGCVIHPGKNKLDGICTLGFVRERYAYKGGDRQRGKNQQQVIAKIIEKVSSSKTLIMNYDKLLKALSGSFETDLSTKNITSVVQFQLNDMRGWNITTANLDGPTGMEPTYTCPKCKRSVMYQNPKTVKAAQEKIKEILEKK